MTNIETILLNHLSEFLAFARARLGDPDLAADVVQDSLLKALKHTESLRDPESARAWFYRILRNTITDLLRRRAAEERVEEALAVDDDWFDAESRVVCGCIQALVPSLKSDYAILIQRIDLDEAPHETVAGELAITPNNLNVRLHRARRQLRERVEATCRVCATHGCTDCTCESKTGNTEPRHV